MPPLKGSAFRLAVVVDDSLVGPNPGRVGAFARSNRDEVFAFRDSASSTLRCRMESAPTA